MNAVLDMPFAFSASWDLLICGYLSLYLESVAEVADSFSKRQKCTVWNGATWYPGVRELVASLSLPGERVNKEGMEATQRHVYTKQEDRRNTINSGRWKRESVIHFVQGVAMRRDTYLSHLRDGELYIFFFLALPIKECTQEASSFN